MVDALALNRDAMTCRATWAVEPSKEEGGVDGCRSSVRRGQLIGGADPDVMPAAAAVQRRSLVEVRG